MAKFNYSEISFEEWMQLQDAARKLRDSGRGPMLGTTPDDDAWNVVSYNPGDVILELMSVIERYWSSER